MSFAENIRQAWNALILNKKRSFLTILGIVVGLSAVITIVSLGDTVTIVVKEFFARQLGSNSVIAVNASFEGEFTSEIRNEYLDEAPDCVYDLFVQTDYFEANAYTSDEPERANNATVLGISGGYKMASNVVPLEYGRFINRQDCDGKKNVIMITDIMAENMFYSKEAAIGNTVTIRSKININNTEVPIYCDYTVVGVFKQVENREELLDSDDSRNESLLVLIPYTSYNKLLNIDSYSMLDAIMMQIVPRDSNSIQDVKKYTEEFMQRLGERDPDYSTVAVITTDEFLEAIGQLISFVMIVFILIAAISLLVGGIGLMNTMLVTVTERTREIGIRKALGAKNSAIKKQFLTESAVICISACTIGILISFGIGILVEANMEKIISLIPDDTLQYIMLEMHLSFTPSFGAIAVSTIFSLAVGLVFGYYPASKGARMQPVDALRYE